MNYAEISKETISLLHKSYASLHNSPLDPEIKVLTELRVSQINGCAYCCNIHGEEAKSLGISNDKLETLSDWQASLLFSTEEKAALHWAESLTALDSDMDRVKQELVALFSERQVVDLTACISLMNALNRLAIALR